MQNNMENVAHDLRVDIARLFYSSGTGHMAPALSCVDILAELYFDGIITYDKRFSPERDRVILSKGHACAALYVTLARAGYFPREELKTFYKKNSRLGGHPNIALPGIETATGALGHGICFGTGTAKAAKIDDKDFFTYVIVGDGETQEGSVWEAASFAANEKLDNLVVILDNNGLQASSFTEEISPTKPIKIKWESFGWQVLTVDGHNFSELHNAFLSAKQSKECPTLIIAETIKGKGVSLAENNPTWHSRVPKDNEWVSVCRDLNISMEELTSL